MATIIQPYNSWREQLATNILAPIISGMMQRSQEANQNRKLNALISKSMEDLGAGNSQQNLMSTPAMPEGYNSNGWASVFHQGETPLTQFDMGTAGLAPVSAPRQNFDQQALRRAVMNNLGTERFNMINPALAEQYLAPLYNSMEQERLSNMKQSAVDAIINATNDIDRRNAMYAGVINGSVPESLVAAENDMYKYNNPHKQFQSVNTGGSTQYGSFEPASGNFIRQGSFKNTADPNTLAQIASQRYIADQNYTIANRAQDLADRKQATEEEQISYERDNPTLTQITGGDGEIYFANMRNGRVEKALTPDGETITDPEILNRIKLVEGDDGYYAIDPYARAGYPVLQPNGEPIQPAKKQTASNRDISDSEKLEYNGLLKEAKELRESIKDYQDTVNIWADEPDSEEYKNAVANLKTAQTRLEEISKRQNEILGKTSGNSSLAPVSGDVQAGGNSNQTQQKFIDYNIPDNHKLFYNSAVDGSISPRNVVSMKQFRNWMTSELRRNPNDPPEALMDYLYKKGFRVNKTLEDK